MSKYLSELEALYREIMQYEENSLPLCAAETPMSPFSKIPLDSNLQEKYIMGGVSHFDLNNNFFEAEYLFRIYELVTKQCKDLFHCKYADPRALSGVNAVMVLLMSLFKDGDTIMISSEDSGGHSSMSLICNRLGISTIQLPFDFEQMDFDYDTINGLLKANKIRGILICPSDLLWQPHLERLNIPPECILIYDATQTLGLIANGVNENPLDKFSDESKFILMGATHKTIPGPTCGLIMTKNLALAQQFDQIINPNYLRNVQFHHILSLSLVLMELEVFGEAYGKNIVENANCLGQSLEGVGFDVVKKELGLYTSTHQLFLPMQKNELEQFMNRCRKFGIALNARYKSLYQGCGIRIGVQAVTRYGWDREDMKEIASILGVIRSDTIDEQILKKRISSLACHREVHYTFDKNTVERINNALHNGKF